MAADVNWNQNTPLDEYTVKYWHELDIGEQLETHKHTLTAEEVREFALEFDPQPYHLDREAAEASIFGGLCASGWQVNALTMRLISEVLTELDYGLLGVRAVNSCRWKMPLFVDDTISATISLVKRNEDSQNSRFGIWQCDVELSNQNQQTVLKMNTNLLIGKAPEQNVA